MIWLKFRSIFFHWFTDCIFSKSVLGGKMFNWWLFQNNIYWHQLLKTAVVGGDPLLVSGLRSDFFLCSVNYCAQFSISSDLVVMTGQIGQAFKACLQLLCLWVRLCRNWPFVPCKMLGRFLSSNKEYEGCDSSRCCCETQTKRQMWMVYQKVKYVTSWLS